jgi:hypothetical protein
MIELRLFEASWCGFRALAPGVGVYSYDLRPLASFVQSFVHSLAAF